jgi:DNA-binding NarL/FixJ family response regulator
MLIQTIELYKEIIKLHAEGLGVEHIGEQIGVSLETIKTVLQGSLLKGI